MSIEYEQFEPQFTSIVGTDVGTDEGCHVTVGRDVGTPEGSAVAVGSSVRQEVGRTVGELDVAVGKVVGALTNPNNEGP